MQELRYILTLLRQNLLVILVGSLSGVGLFAAANALIPTRYATSASFRLREDLTPLNYGGIIRVAPLRMLLQNGVNLAATAEQLNARLQEPEAAAKAMGMNATVCRHVLGVNASPPKPQQPEINNFWGDVVVTLTLDRHDLPLDSLTTGVWFYLSHSAYLSEQFAQRQQFFSAQLYKLQRDQRQLDSIRHRATPAEVAALTAVAATLYKEETELNERIKNNRLHVVLPFSQPARIQPYSWQRVILFGLAVGFLFTVAVIVFRKEIAKV